MSALSNYLETALLNHVFRATAMTAPTNVYISLHTADPTDTALSTEVSTTSTGYARKQVATASGFSAPADDGSGAMQIQNNAAITFATPTASWSTVTHFGVWDALSAGNLLVYGLLSASKTIGTGDTVQFDINQLTIKLA